MAPSKHRRGLKSTKPTVISDLEVKVNGQDNGRKGRTGRTDSVQHNGSKAKPVAAAVPRSTSKPSTGRISSPPSSASSSQNTSSNREKDSSDCRHSGRNSSSEVKSTGSASGKAERTTRRAGSSSDRPTYDEYGVLRTNLDKTSAAFRQRLTSDTGQFQPSTGATIVGMKGSELTVEWARKYGLSTPIRFAASEKVSLGLEIPPEVNPHVVATLVGANRKVVAMDVANQRSNCSFTLQGWADNWTQKPRTRVLNMISLEFSGTPLAAQVKSPSFVRQVDWVGRTFPLRPTTAAAAASKYRAHKKTAGAGSAGAESSSTNATASSSNSTILGSSSGVNSTTVYEHKGFGSTTRPKVQYYCLMSMAQSYTDFHVDFGGTSVWYHLVSGRKVFLLAPPTPSVLSAFNDFTFDSSAFLPDLLPPHTFTRVELRAGETLLIPAGWVHAVLTPSDSVVFGGNFLHSFGIKEQAEIMEQEVRTSVAPSMRFPLAHELCWRVVVQYAALVLQKQRQGSVLLNMHHEDGNGIISDDDDIVWTRGLTSTECREVRSHLVQRCLANKQLFLNVAPSWVEDAPKLIDWLKDVLSQAEAKFTRKAANNGSSSGDTKKRENEQPLEARCTGRGVPRNARRSKDRVASAALEVDPFPGANLTQLRSFLPPNLLPVPASNGHSADVGIKDDAAEELLERPIVEEWFQRANAAANTSRQGDNNINDDEKDNINGVNFGNEEEGDTGDEFTLQAAEEFARLTKNGLASKSADIGVPTGDATRTNSATTTRGKTGLNKRGSSSSKSGNSSGGCTSATSSAKGATTSFQEEALPTIGLLPVGIIVNARFKRSQKWFSGTVVGVANATCAQDCHITCAVDAEQAINMGVAAAEGSKAIATATIMHSGAESDNEPTISSSSTTLKQHQIPDVSSSSSVPSPVLHKAAVSAASKVAYQVCFDDGDYDPACKRDCIKGQPLDPNTWPMARAKALRTLAAFNRAQTAWELALTKAERLAKKRAREDANAEEAAAAAVDASFWPFEHPSQSTEAPGAKRFRAHNAVALARYSLNAILNEATANKTTVSSASRHSKLGLGVTSELTTQSRMQQHQLSMESPGVKKMRARTIIAPARLSLNTFLREATKNQSAPAASNASATFTLYQGLMNPSFMARLPLMPLPMPRVATAPQHGQHLGQDGPAAAPGNLTPTAQSSRTEMVKSGTKRSSAVSARELAAIAREPIDSTVAHALANSLEHTAAATKATADEARALVARMSSNDQQMRLPRGTASTGAATADITSGVTASANREVIVERDQGHLITEPHSGLASATINALLAPQASELAASVRAKSIANAHAHR